MRSGSEGQSLLKSYQYLCFARTTNIKISSHTSINFFATTDWYIVVPYQNQYLDRAEVAVLCITRQPGKDCKTLCAQKARFCFLPFSAQMTAVDAKAAYCNNTHCPQSTKTNNRLVSKHTPSGPPAPLAFSCNDSGKLNWCIDLFLTA